VREIEDLVRRYQAMSATATSRSERESSPVPALATEAQRLLADHLQTRVRVEVGKRKGKIIVDFVSTEELDRLTKIITGEAEGARAHTVSLD
jgi:ParB family chromosome partitioning protein